MTGIASACGISAVMESRGSTRRSFGRNGRCELRLCEVIVWSKGGNRSAAWARAELSTPPKTYLLFLQVWLPSS